MPVDNQKDLIWLAGLFDGEGCITIAKHFHSWRGGKYLQYYPIAQISNTNQLILNECMRILSEEKIGFNFVTYSPTKYSRSECYAIRITGKKQVLKFLPLIKDSLIGKKAEANLMLEFISKSRVLEIHQRNKNTGRFQPMGNTKLKIYSEKIYIKLKSLKKKNRLSI